MTASSWVGRGMITLGSAVLLENVILPWDLENERMIWVRSVLSQKYSRSLLKSSSPHGIDRICVWLLTVSGMARGDCLWTARSRLSSSYLEVNIWSQYMHVHIFHSFSLIMHLSFQQFNHSLENTLFFAVIYLLLCHKHEQIKQNVSLSFHTVFVDQESGMA